MRDRREGRERDGVWVGESGEREGESGERDRRKVLSFRIQSLYSLPPDIYHISVHM